MLKNQKMIIAAVIVIAAAGIGYLLGDNMANNKEKKARQSADAYAVDSIKAIASTWDAEALTKRMHPILQDEIKKSGYSAEEYMKKMQQLGKLQKDINCNFLNMAWVVTPEQHFTMASYLCKAEFEKSNAMIGLDIRRDGSDNLWHILHFQVNSPLFNSEQEKSSDEKPAGKSEKK